MEKNPKTVRRGGLHRLLDCFLSDRLFALRLVITLAVTGTVFYCFNYLTPLAADDYWYTNSFATGERIKSVKDIFQSLYAHYFQMNGRMVTHFLAHLFLMFDKQVFNLVNTVSFLLLGLLMGWHSGFLRGKKRAIRLGLIYAMLYWIIPAFAEDFLWVDGASNYLYGILIILIYLIPFRKLLEESYVQKPPLFLRECILALGNLVFGIIAGATNENTGAAIICVSALMMGIHKFLYHRSLRAWMLTGWVGNVAGFLFMLLAPGNAMRITLLNLTNAANQGGMLSIIPPGVFQAVRSVVAALTSILSYHMPVFLLFAMVMMFYFRRNEQESLQTKWRRLVPCIVFFVASALSAGAFVVSASSPERVWSGSIIFALISIGCAVSVLEWDCELERLTIQVILPAILVVCTLASCVNTVWELNLVYVQHNERIESAIARKAAGEENFSVEPIYSISRFSLFNTLTSETSGDFLAEFYGGKDLQ